VSCGQVARSQWAVIVDPTTGQELPDGSVGEIWLHGENICRGYWGRPDESLRTFGARLQSRLPAVSHAHGAPVAGQWLRTGDLGVYLDGELYVTGRRADLVTIDGMDHYPQDIEATAAEASPMVRRGYVTAFTDEAQRLVIIAERAAGTSRADPQPAVEAVRAAVLQKHGLAVSEVRFLPAGAIPRTTSGKLARRASRARYLAG
jgi:fatty-acyl-CoA synthase